MIGELRPHRTKKGEDRKQTKREASMCGMIWYMMQYTKHAEPWTWTWNSLPSSM